MRFYLEVSLFLFIFVLSNYLKQFVMSKVSGYVVYEGPSQINGEPIVGIVTMSSNNIKTGNMASLWILHANSSPIEASKSGDDVAVCGNCPLRHHSGGACYVTLFQAPLAVYKAYKGNKYPRIDNYVPFEGVNLRFGAYGDPLALPIDVLVGLKSVIKNNTSYTHQWRNTTSEVVKQLSMASADSIEEAIEAQGMGWRTFRVTKDETDLMENEILCPNYTSDVQCVNCNLCKGASTKAKNIVIPVHGARKGKFTEGK